MKAKRSSAEQARRGKLGGRPRKQLPPPPPPEQRLPPLTGGRPTKCTPELIAAYAEAYVGHNGDRVGAALAVGIDDATVLRWWQWGSAGREPYATFCGKARATHAKVVAILGGRLAQTGMAKGSDDPRDLLRDPKEARAVVARMSRAWAPPERVEVTGKDGGPLDVKAILERASKMTDEELDDMIAREAGADEKEKP